MLCDLEEALFPSISIQFIHPAIFEDPACSSQYRSDGRSKNLQGTKNRKNLEGKDVASGTVDIWGGGSDCPPIHTLVPSALLRTNIAGPRLLEFTSIRLKMVDWTFDCH